MALALFDLDNTLLAGDSDYLWGVFLSEQGIVDAQAYEQENQRFYDEYKQGTLDIYEFLAFSLKPLAENDADTLRSLRTQFGKATYIRVHPCIGKFVLHAAANTHDCSRCGATKSPPVGRVMRPLLSMLRGWPQDHPALHRPG